MKIPQHVFTFKPRQSQGIRLVFFPAGSNLSSVKQTGQVSVNTIFILVHSGAYKHLQYWSKALKKANNSSSRILSLRTYKHLNHYRGKPINFETLQLDTILPSRYIPEVPRQRLVLWPVYSFVWQERGPNDYQLSLSLSYRYRNLKKAFLRANYKSNVQTAAWRAVLATYSTLNLMSMIYIARTLYQVCLGWSFL